MGVVYEATQLSLNRTVALKILRRDLSDDSRSGSGSAARARSRPAIDHPHIVTVYEAGETRARPVHRDAADPGAEPEGHDHRARARRGPHAADPAPVADALDAAHEAGLIHRDIKPQNILVGARDQPFLADFGLTKGSARRA